MRRRISIAASAAAAASASVATFSPRWSSVALMPRAASARTAASAASMSSPATKRQAIARVTGLLRMMR